MKIVFLLIVTMNLYNQAHAGLRSMCGGSDSRKISSFAPIARMLKVGYATDPCTGTLVSPSCMISAGHCLNWLKIAEFKVPLSNSQGVMQFAPAEHRYLVTEVIDSSTDILEDWSVFKLAKNSETGTRAGDVYGFYKISAVAPKVGEQIRISGYGHSKQNELNYCQQSAVGKIAANQSEFVSHDVDTDKGNSGAAIILESNEEVIGVHTSGGCGPTSWNTGTLISSYPRFSQAIQKCMQGDF